MSIPRQFQPPPPKKVKFVNFYVFAAWCFQLVSHRLKHLHFHLQSAPRMAALHGCGGLRRLDDTSSHYTFRKRRVELSSLKGHVYQTKLAQPYIFFFSFLFLILSPPLTTFPVLRVDVLRRVRMNRVSLWLEYLSKYLTGLINRPNKNKQKNHFSRNSAQQTSGRRKRK